MGRFFILKITIILRILLKFDFLVFMLATYIIEFRIFQLVIVRCGLEHCSRIVKFVGMFHYIDFINIAVFSIIKGRYKSPENFSDL